MSVEQSSVFLVASILMMIGFVAIAAGIILVNNLLFRYWKPIKFSLLSKDEPYMRFATEEELKTNKDK